MKKILFPTDFSATAENALHFALALAKKLSARVDLINIYQLPFASASDVPPEMIHKMLDSKKAVVEEKLHAFMGHNGSSKLGHSRAVYGIFVPQEIVDTAKKDNYDLIVMGMKGQHNPMERMMGSVTTQTMMQAPCPVLAVPEEAPFETIKKIAYATNLQPRDKQAVEQLMGFAGQLNAAVHFVHVEKEPGFGLVQDQVVSDNYPHRFINFTIVKNPSIMKGLDQYIKEQDIDLLSLFIPRRRLWERLFHTSFTKRMSFHSKTPLLVFHG